MELFDLKKTKKLKVSKEVKPTVVSTNNVAKELLSVAKSNNVKIKLLDFHILDIQTNTRILEDDVKIDWKEHSKDKLVDINNEKTLMNKNLEIKQIYKVKIFLKDIDNELKNFKVAIYTNATKCRIYIKIASGSKIKYYKDLETDLKELINKSKIRARILVYLFDEVQEKALDKLVSYIRANKEVQYEKAQTILVAEGYEPISTINDELILHFENKPEIDEKKKIDYASRGFIKSAKKEELIIEYIKPKEGKPGRNCRGEYIDFTEPIIKNEPSFKIDNSIKIIEEKNSILYKAIHEGYIAFENNTYSIADEMDTGSIDFKTTGNISTGVDSKVTINVKEKDIMKDAIGQGMKIEVTALDIDGHIGANALVIAKRATVGGQTHKTSVLNVEDLKVETHRGTINGKDIIINRLEHGIVNGENIEIVKAIGGEIRGKDITIDTCISHVRVVASRRIEIMNLEGSENIFKIDPLLQETANQGLEKNQEEISELETILGQLKKEIKEYTQLVENNTSVFNDIKKKLAYYKKQGIKMPHSFINKYKQLSQAQKHLESIKNTYKIKEEKHMLLTTKTVSFQDDIFNARIINRDKWTEHNELIFKLVDPPIELSFKPEEGSSDKIFAIVKVNDAKLEIKAVEE